MGKTKGWRPLTSDEQQDILDRYVAGETMVALAADYQRSTLTVRNILTAAGVTIRNKVVSTPIELRLHDALRHFGIGFTTQALLGGRYLADVLVNQAPVVIEADGAVHLRPKVTARDAVRDATLAALGYTTYRLTGGEINTDALAAAQRVILAAGLVPDENPIYDVRTTFTGDSHPLWKGGKREYVCCICSTTFLAQPKHRRGPDYYCSPQCVGEGKRGKRHTAEHRAKIAAGQLGKPKSKHPPVTEETRAKLRALHLGKPKSPEHVAKVAAALRGRQVSDETRAKISETLKRRNANQIKIESGLTGDRESQAEMTWPLASGEG